MSERDTLPARLLGTEPRPLKKIFVALSRCIRPRVIGLFVMGEAAILLYALWGEPGFTFAMWLERVLRVSVALVPLMAAGFLMNDLLDIEIDRANRRVVYVDAIGSNLTMVLVILFFLIAVVAGFFTGAGFGVIILCDAIALVIYNLYGKRFFALKPFLVSAIIVTIYPMAVLATPWGEIGPQKLTLFVHGGWLYLMALAYEILHDVADVSGDRFVGYATFPAVIGEKQAKKLAGVFALLACGLALVPRLNGWCGNVYLAFAAVHATVIVSSLFVSVQARIRTILAAIVLIISGSFLDVVISHYPTAGAVY